MKEQARKNRRRVWTVAIVLAVLGIVLGLVLWTRSDPGAAGITRGSTTPTQPGSMMRVNDGGQITITVTWQGRSAGPIFAVEMDTHAVDLDGYDLRSSSLSTKRLCCGWGL